MSACAKPRIAAVVVSVVVAVSACDHDASPPPASPTPTLAPPVEGVPAPVRSAPAPTASAAPVSPAPSADGLAVGSPAPDFTATATDGASLHIAALKGKPVVVYFYPKDETEGCTTEACAFRDAWATLSKTGVVLIGISGDTNDSHRSFAEDHKLPFHLVSDPSGTIAGLYGVPFKNGYASRQSFVIGPDGKLKRIYRHVDVLMHAAQIARDLAP